MKLSTLALLTIAPVVFAESLWLSASAAPEIAAPKLVIPGLQDVLRGDSQDFFRAGRQQFEQQVQELQRRPLKTEVLKIDPKLRRVDQEVPEQMPLGDRPPVEHP